MHIVSHALLFALLLRSGLIPDVTVLVFSLAARKSGSFKLAF